MPRGRETNLSNTRVLPSRSYLSSRTQAQPTPRRQNRIEWCGRSTGQMNNWLILLEAARETPPRAPSHLKREQSWTRREVHTRVHRLTPHFPSFLLPLPSSSPLPFPPSLFPRPLGMHRVLITYRILLCPSGLELDAHHTGCTSRGERGRLLCS